MYVQKEMEQYVKNMKYFVDKYTQGEKIDSKIKSKILKEGWNNSFNQKVAWGYVVQRLSTTELAKRLGVSRQPIHDRLEKLKISCRNNSQSQRPKKLEKENIEKSKNLILGTLLGDAHLRKPEGNSKATRYIHTNVKSEYSSLIQENLNSFGIKTSYNISKEKRKNRFNSIQIQSKGYSYFYQLRQEWYPEGIKIVPKSLELNPEIMLYWYLDDGSLTDYDIRLYTNAFDKKSDQHLQKELKTKFNIISVKTKAQKDLDYIRISGKKEKDKFLKIVFSKYENMNISCFDYKFKGLI